MGGVCLVFIWYPESSCISCTYCIMCDENLLINEASPISFISMLLIFVFPHIQCNNLQDQKYPTVLEFLHKNRHRC